MAHLHRTSSRLLLSSRFLSVSKYFHTDDLGRPPFPVDWTEGAACASLGPASPGCCSSWALRTVKLAPEMPAYI